MGMLHTHTHTCTRTRKHTTISSEIRRPRFGAPVSGGWNVNLRIPTQNRDTGFAVPGSPPENTLFGLSVALCGAKNRAQVLICVRQGHCY